MTKDQAQNRLCLAAHLARIAPERPAHLIAADVRAFARHAATCRRIAEDECNGTGDADRNRRTLNRVGRHLGKQDGLLASYPGMKATIEGDPRGYVFHLKHPNLPGNTWGGQEQGYGVA